MDACVQAVSNGSVRTQRDANQLVYSTLLAYQISGCFLEAATTAALNCLLGERPDTRQLR